MKQDLTNNFPDLLAKWTKGAGGNLGSVEHELRAQCYHLHYLTACVPQHFTDVSPATSDTTHTLPTTQTSWSFSFDLLNDT